MGRGEPRPPHWVVGSGGIAHEETLEHSRCDVVVAGYMCKYTAWLPGGLGMPVSPPSHCPRAARWQPNQSFLQAYHIPEQVLPRLFARLPCPRFATRWGRIACSPASLSQHQLVPALFFAFFLLSLPGNICSHLLACLPCYSATTSCPGHLFAHLPTGPNTTIWQPGLACLHVFHGWAMAHAGLVCTHACHVSGPPSGDLATPVHKSAVSESHRVVT